PFLFGGESGFDWNPSFDQERSDAGHRSVGAQEEVPLGLCPEGRGDRRVITVHFPQFFSVIHHLSLIIIWL
ncbi:MAG: hypothetical protein KZQ86_00150, partial [Candidatus Thiodiazotropha sp. (ex Lucinoma kastoroae)]|nr:hypothetical protein [Candidatus Thiodiazotropha sp. (ex Lucinoma kastoroae)]